MNSKTSKNTQLISRRKALLGAGAASLLPLIPLSEVEAQAKAIPTRLVLWFTPNGTIRDEWLPDGGESDFTFKKILAPLADFREKLVILDGIKFERQGPGNDHMRGPHNMFAGSLLLDGTFTGGDMNADKSGWGSHISIDQHLVNELKPETPFKSLTLAVNPNVNANVRHRLAYTAGNQPITPEVDPYNLFQSVFAPIAGVGEEAKAKLERQRLERKSIIDLVTGELGTLRGQFGVSDQRKVDAHLDALRAIERRLDNTTAPGLCTLPGQPTKLDPHANDNFETIGKAQMDLLATSLACDMTRVASLMWSGSTSNQRFGWLGADKGHHEISHEPDDAGTLARQQLIDINVWYSQQFAYFLKALDSIPEGDGTVLDHSIIVWGNELGRGNTHSPHPIPVVLAGGGSGAFKTGRKLTLDQVQINRLLVSLCQMMGLPETQTFGNLDKGTGPLLGLT